MSDDAVALQTLDDSIRYYREDYIDGLSQGWERYFGLAYGLAAQSRAALHLGQTDLAVASCREALTWASRKRIDAFALLGLIAAAEIEWSAGNTDRAIVLTALVASHPHTFAADRAEAQHLLNAFGAQPDLTLPPPDLWETVRDLLES
ncbi:MAG: hypothetical protein IPK19_15150 [Chloroflexi bacterium]|nr:hypothetical protein [Chloroflexota bacterium]